MKQPLENKPKTSIEAEIITTQDGVDYRSVGFYDHRDDTWHCAQHIIPAPKEWRVIQEITEY